MKELTPIQHKHLEKVLNILDEAKLPPLIQGEPGIGKTEAIRNYADKYGYDLSVIHLQQMSVGDIHGLRFPDKETGKTIQFPPDFLPGKGDNKTLLFLDELGACPEFIRKAALELILERRCGKYKLADKHWIVAATNTEQDGVVTYNFDRATADRFVHIRLSPNLDDWFRYAKEKGVDSRIQGFLHINPGEFAASTAALIANDIEAGDEELITVVPTPRSWTRLSVAIKEIKDLDKDGIPSIVQGFVGARASRGFLNYARQVSGYQNAEKLMSCGEDEIKKLLPKTPYGLTTLGFALMTKIKDAPSAIRVMTIAVKINELKLDKNKDSAGDYIKFNKREIVSWIGHLSVSNVIKVLGEDEANKLLLEEANAELNEKILEITGRETFLAKSAKSGGEVKDKGKSKTADIIDMLEI